MELLQAQTAVRLGQVCPCVNQPQPCFCEERAGYSSLSYDYPLTIDTNIEYELKDLHADMGKSKNNSAIGNNALQIDYSLMAIKGQIPHATETHQSFWTQQTQQVYPIHEQTSDLYQMIDTMDPDVNVDMNLMQHTGTYDCYNASNTYDSTAYFQNGYSYPSGHHDQNNMYASSNNGTHYHTQQKYSNNKWGMERDIASCNFPHNSTGSTASSTTSNYQAQCRAY